jgi:hypothetical protein
MDRVHLGVVVRQPLQESGAIEALQTVLASKLSEDALRIARDVLRAGVERIGLCDLDRAQLPRPRIERPEDATVKRLPMRQVVVAGKSLLGQRCEGKPHDVGLGLRELLWIVKPKVVAQGTSARIDVRILGH